MNKRYQVFVSSTYEDLQEERKEVMQALLELDCIPAGMELFPASNEEQWELIKRVIDDSDYYILIIGGRYGCLGPQGIGYTEMEYQYAIEQGKPVMAFLHKDPGKINADKTEKSEDGITKLKLFRELAQTKMAKYWMSPADLGSVVSRGMVNLIKQFPATGWVKADNINDENSMREIFKLQKENEELKIKLQANKTQAPNGVENLCQGDDELILQLLFNAETESDFLNYVLPVTVTWNEVYAIVSPYLTNESDESVMREAIVHCLKKNATNDLHEFLNSDDDFIKLTDFKISNEEFQSIKIQFKALGFIQQSNKSRSVNDRKDYWTLTEYGEYVMTKLVAKQRGCKDIES